MSATLGGWGAPPEAVSKGRILVVDDDRLVLATLAHGLAQVPPGVSGLGLVRALLPRRTATMSLVQDGNSVLASIALVPPGVTLLEPADVAH